jgi:hypothetical protein
MRSLSSRYAISGLADLPPAERHRLWYQARQDARRTRFVVGWSVVAGLIAAVSIRLDWTGAIAGVTAGGLIAWLALRVQTRREVLAAWARNDETQSEVARIAEPPDARTEALQGEFRRRFRAAAAALYLGVAILAIYIFGGWVERGHEGALAWNYPVAYGSVSAAAFYGLLALSGWLARCPGCGKGSKLNTGAYCPCCELLLRPEARRVGSGSEPGGDAFAGRFTTALRRVLRWRMPAAIVLVMAGVIALAPILGLVPVTARTSCGGWPHRRSSASSSARRLRG